MTHNTEGAAIEAYTSWEWSTLCSEVTKLKVDLHPANLIVLPVAKGDTYETTPIYAQVFASDFCHPRSKQNDLSAPAADKLLMFAAFVTLTRMGWAPVWFTAIVIGRDIIIIGGTIVYQLRVAPIHGEPTGASKLNTVFQILFILLTVNHAWLGWPPMAILRVLMAAILVTIGISTIQYVTTGMRRLRQTKQGH